MPTPEDPDETEPTQPVGYWERRASEQAAEQARAQGGQPYPTTPYPQGGPVFNPTSAQPSTAAAAGPAGPGYAPGPRVRARTRRTPTPRTPTARSLRPAHAGVVRRAATRPPTGAGQPAPYLPDAALRRLRGAASRPSPGHAGAGAGPGRGGRRVHLLRRDRWWSRRSPGRRPQRAQGHPGLPGSARRREPGPDRDDPRHHRHGAADPRPDRPGRRSSCWSPSRSRPPPPAARSSSGGARLRAGSRPAPAR